MSVNPAPLVAALKARAGGIFQQQVLEKVVSEYINLGFEKSYWIKNFTQEEIAEHIYGYLCAKVDAHDFFKYTVETETQGFYFCLSRRADQREVEQRIEEHWLRANTTVVNGQKVGVTVRCYYSDRKTFESYAITAEQSQWTQYVTNFGVSLYVVELSPFHDPQATGTTDVKRLCTTRFWQTRLQSDPEVVQRYQRTIDRLNASFLHTVHDRDRTPSGAVVLQVGVKGEKDTAYFVALSTFIEAFPGVSFQKKVVETFSNGMHVYTFYIYGLSEDSADHAAGVLGEMPSRQGSQFAITQLYGHGKISLEQGIYATALVVFAVYFTKAPESPEYADLVKSLRHEPASLRKLQRVRDELYRELVSEKSIATILAKHLTIFNELFKDFTTGTADAPNPEIAKMVASVLSKTERDVLNSFVLFNRAVISSNFHKTQRGALALRLDPSFLKCSDFPRVPYAIFLIIGAQFRGFHIRFHDIARGGIRLIRSRGNTEADRKRAFNVNRAMLFIENYNLAHTQMLKNKDIPESGSKGTILVSLRATATNKMLYMQYIDAMVDLMIPNVPGVRKRRADAPNGEILFFGPDEGTADDFPSLAALHARRRGYKQWMSVATGKSPEQGGVPHDTYGMTTQSVREYAMGIYRRLNLKQENLTKCMTGGPDGDLGSNEIKFGKERVVAICDGFASVHDPKGIDRDELLRLANARLSLAQFDKSKLSPQGFHVGVDESNVKLPDGTVVPSGTVFRNNFHFTKYADADIFIPCGGRPATVTLSNVHKMLRNASGVTGDAMLAFHSGDKSLSLRPQQLRFRFIVEGANLFITEEARLALENVGVILFKDSSANKGGVTSSSLEVLAGLSLSEKEHLSMMCIKPGATPPPFYRDYVQEICQRIRDNARREFDCIWDEAAKPQPGGDTPSRTLISNQLSLKINSLKNQIMASDLSKDPVLFRYVLHEYLPKKLLTQVPLDEILRRVPHSYQMAIFAMSIASQSVYETGLSGGDFAFFRFMHNLHARAQKFAEEDAKKVSSRL